MTKKPKTLIFDLGGVYFADGTSNAVEVISSKFGIDRQKVVEVFYGELNYAYRKGAITHDEFWNRAKHYWNRMDLSTRELAQIWLDGYKPIPETVAIIDELRAQKYPIYVLSNNAQERIDFLQARYNFLNKFDGSVLSHLVGYNKPELEIYKLALEKANAAASESVFIDDKAKFLEQAESLGMSTVHFTSPQALFHGLESLGINLRGVRDKVFAN